MGYEQIRAQLNQNAHQNTLSSFQNAFIAGASSGMVSYHGLHDTKRLTKQLTTRHRQFAAVVTTPFDVIKTQRQVSSGRGKAIYIEKHMLVPMFLHGSKKKDAQIRQLVAKIVWEEGYKGFFRGEAATVVCCL